MENQESNQRSVLILGAGIIGLSIAHTLSSDPSNKITIIARDMPDEHNDSQGWASPWAGANWSPIGDFDKRIHKWETLTFNKLWDMIPSGLAMELPSRVYHEDLTASPDVWWKDIVRDFRVLSSEELPLGVKSGFAYTTVSIRPAQYLHWIKTELTARGVSFITTLVGSIEEAASYGDDTSILINATGLGSRSLLGVEDPTVHPIRGQTIIVQAPQVKQCLSNLTFNTLGETTYIIPRPDGSVILGGTFQPDNWDTSVNHKTARGIFERCSALIPDLLPSSKESILSHNVGLRPARRGGPRVEVETVQLPLGSDLVPHKGGAPRPSRLLKVIHAYGFGPAGYQNSWGAAQEVASLLETI